MLAPGGQVRMLGGAAVRAQSGWDLVGIAAPAVAALRVGRPGTVRRACGVSRERIKSVSERESELSHTTLAYHFTIPLQN